MRLRAEAGRTDDAGNLELATAQAAEALAVVERGANLRDSDLALFILDLARLYANGSDRQKARPLLERSLSLLEGSVGPHHPWTAIALCDLGVVLTNDGDYVQADAVLHRALADPGKGARSG